MLGEVRHGRPCRGLALCGQPEPCEGLLIDTADLFLWGEGMPLAIFKVVTSGNVFQKNKDGRTIVMSTDWSTAGQGDSREYKAG